MFDRKWGSVNKHNLGWIVGSKTGLVVRRADNLFPAKANSNTIFISNFKDKLTNSSCWLMAFI